MENNLFITDVKIKKVRNLKNIEIKLNEKEKKHLIFTGKNGSGKTSVLKAMASYIDNIENIENYKKSLKIDLDNLEFYKKNNDKISEKETEKRIEYYKQKILNSSKGIDLFFNISEEKIAEEIGKGNLITAYYKAERIFEADIPRQIEKVELKDNYRTEEVPRKEFIKYLLDLKATQAFSRTGNKQDKAEKIGKWFDSFEKLLQNIFDSRDLKLIFDEETFQFKLEENGKEPFDFNTLSSGYAAVLDIVVDIIIRMEKKTGKNFKFDMQGIVLIDEIETHLHLELQKRILKLLTTIFPNIQFIITTHSPFILSSLENTVIYDLEKNLTVENGLTNLPYEGIVEGYFKADSLSEELRKKFEEYKLLVKKEKLQGEDFEKISSLEFYLDEIPDYLALDLNSEYKKLKSDLRNRDDLNG